MALLTAPKYIKFDNPPSMTKLYTASQVLKPHLHSADPELPTLATRAAIELDSLHRGRTEDATSVHRLSELLRNSVEKVQLPQDRQFAALMDASTVVIVARALRCTDRGEAKTTKEVLEMTRVVADELEQAAAQQTGEHLDELREFCLELARGTAAHHHSFRSSRAPQPFRR